MDVLQTERLPPSPEGIARAAGLLAAGRIVALPTETVYGLAADARDAAAIAGVFAAKARPAFNPLIAHVRNVDAAWDIAQAGAEAERLANAFWPGPLTLVLPLREDAALAPIATAGLGTVAVRVPSHPLAQEVLAAFGGPLAAPSANPSGRLSPTTAGHVLEGLRGRIDAVLDGGPCPVGVESTIVSLTDRPRLLRPGGVSAEAIAECLGTALAPAEASERPNAPGQLASHYAPRARIRMDAHTAEAGETLLGFGPVGGDVSLSPTGDLAEAAANLFAHLARIDATGTDRIAVAPIPDHGLGQAINDRLRRAAAPRP